MAILLEFSRKEITILEEEIEKKSLEIVRSRKLWLSHKMFPFRVHILSGHRCEIKVASGKIVHIYITGLNIYGGDYSLVDKDFWNAMDRALRVIPRMFVSTDLVALSGVVSVTMKEVKEQVKTWKVAKGEPPELWVLGKDVEQVSISGQSTFIHRPSKLKVVIPFNEDSIDDIHKEATIRLSQLWYETNNDVPDEE